MQACSFPQHLSLTATSCPTVTADHGRKGKQQGRQIYFGGGVHASENHTLSLIIKVNSQVRAAAAKACPQASIYPLAVEHVYNLC